MPWESGVAGGLRRRKRSSPATSSWATPTGWSCSRRPSRPRCWPTPGSRNGRKSSSPPGRPGAGASTTSTRLATAHRADSRPRLAQQGICPVTTRPRLPRGPLDREVASRLAGAEHLLVELADRHLRDLGHERPVLRHLPARRPSLPRKSVSSKASALAPAAAPRRPAAVRPSGRRGCRSPRPPARPGGPSAGSPDRPRRSTRRPT